MEWNHFVGCKCIFWNPKPAHLRNIFLSQENVIRYETDKELSPKLCRIIDGSTLIRPRKRRKGGILLETKSIHTAVCFTGFCTDDTNGLLGTQY